MHRRVPRCPPVSSTATPVPSTLPSTHSSRPTVGSTHKLNPLSVRPSSDPPAYPLGSTLTP